MLAGTAPRCRPELYLGAGWNGISWKLISGNLGNCGRSGKSAKEVVSADGGGGSTLSWKRIKMKIKNLN